MQDSLGNALMDIWWLAVPAILVALAPRALKRKALFVAWLFYFGVAVYGVLGPWHDYLLSDHCGSLLDSLLWLYCGGGNAFLKNMSALWVLSVGALSWMTAGSLRTKFLKIRRARTSDAAAIRNVVRAAYAPWVPIIGREPRPMGADYDAAIKVHRFDVIRDQNQIVALVETEARQDHYWIENIAVLPDWQGEGLGRRLLAHAEGLARAAGVVEIRLLTNGKMAANRRLYASVGYVEDREEPFGDGTVVYLSKRLG